MPRFAIHYGGFPIGKVMLDHTEPAAGWLEIADGYLAIRSVIRSACNRLWESRFREDMMTRMAEAQSDSVKRLLTLATEQGTVTPVASIDLWDDDYHDEPPFVLVYFHGQPTGPRAFRLPGLLPGARSTAPDERPTL